MNRDIRRILDEIRLQLPKPKTVPAELVYRAPGSEPGSGATGGMERTTGQITRNVPEPIGEPVNDRLDYQSDAMKGFLDRLRQLSGVPRANQSMVPVRLGLDLKEGDQFETVKQVGFLRASIQTIYQILSEAKQKGDWETGVKGALWNAELAMREQSIPPEGSVTAESELEP